MDFTFDLLQGAGIAAALGIRPLLPVLLVGALASSNVAIDFDGTDFAFLESPGFLAAVVALVVAAELIRRRAGDDALERGAGLAAIAAITVVLGALQGAGSLADRGHQVLPGLVVGAACAALGLVASRAFFSRVRSRLDTEAAGYLPLYREGLGLAAAALSLAVPPLALIVVGVLVWLLLGERRREGEKFAGLRILR